jgi:hypothetical protein
VCKGVVHDHSGLFDCDRLPSIDTFVNVTKSPILATSVRKNGHFFQMKRLRKLLATMSKLYQEMNGCMSPREMLRNTIEVLRAVSTSILYEEI